MARCRRETAKGHIFEGGFARQWFIKKHLFKGSPISYPTANSTATSVLLRLYKWMKRENGMGRRGGGTGRVGARVRRSVHPTVIRRVGVIEVIAILCPVNPTVLASSPSLNDPPPSFFPTVFVLPSASRRLSTTLPVSLDELRRVCGIVYHRHACFNLPAGKIILTRMYVHPVYTRRSGTVSRQTATARLRTGTFARGAYFQTVLRVYKKWERLSQAAATTTTTTTIPLGRSKEEIRYRAISIPR